MLHSEKPLPPAITHNDEIARLILVEMRGLRDDMAVKAPTFTASSAGTVELREPAPPAERPLDALAGPKRPKKAP
jgi:hypothetical protein